MLKKWNSHYLTWTTLSNSPGSIKNSESNRRIHHHKRIFFTGPFCISLSKFYVADYALLLWIYSQDFYWNTIHCGFMKWLGLSMAKTFYIMIIEEIDIFVILESLLQNELLGIIQSPILAKFWFDCTTALHKLLFWYFIKPNNTSSYSHLLNHSLKSDRSTKFWIYRTLWLSILGKWKCPWKWQQIANDILETFFSGGYLSAFHISIF